MKQVIMPRTNPAVPFFCFLRMLRKPNRIALPAIPVVIRFITIETAMAEEVNMNESPLVGGKARKKLIKVK